jgi:predicted N-acetyltransferase YhbS
MQVEDVDAILAIDRKITGQQRALTYEFDVDRSIGGQLDFSFVAEVDGTPVGFLLSSPAYVPDQVTQACLLLALGVDPEYRQQGLGRRLVETLLEACSAQGVKMLRAMVDEHDHQLREFFEHLEFLPGRLVEYYKVT